MAVATSAKATTQNNQKLMKALNVTPLDLAANRAGQLSKQQRKVLLPPPTSDLVQMVLVGHFLLIVGIVGVIAWAVNEPAMWVVFIVIMAVVGLPLTLVGGRGFKRPVLIQDVQAGEVMQVCGIVRREHVSGRMGYYRLSIEAHQWHVPSSVYHAVADGSMVCAYYLPQSKHLLALEMVDNSG